MEDYNDLKKMKAEYYDLIDCLNDTKLMFEIFQCPSCKKWKHRDEECGNDSACSCEWVCEDCDEEHHWVCNGCETKLCRYCEEENDAIHYHPIGDFDLLVFCDECIIKVCKNQHSNKYIKVMKELVRKRRGIASTLSICELKEKGITYKKSVIEYWKNYSGI